MVYKRAGGLTAADKQKILADQQAINEAGSGKINVVGAATDSVHPRSRTGPRLQER